MPKPFRIQGALITFEHVGAPCPAGCGYVFSNGFSKLLIDDDRRTDNMEHCKLTICTRCSAVLRITDAGPVHVLPVEVALLDELSQGQLEIARELMRQARINMGLH